MADIGLNDAEIVGKAALQHAREIKLQPLLVVVLDSRGTVKFAAAEDGTGTGRFAVAFAKANGALAMGMGSRALAQRAKDLPVFYTSLAGVIPGGMVPGPGGVLIRNATGEIIGAVGISGDIGDNDERAAIAGIEKAAFTPVPADP